MSGETLAEAVERARSAESKINRALHIIDTGSNFIMRRVRNVLSGDETGKDRRPMVLASLLQEERRIKASLLVALDRAMDFMDHRPGCQHIDAGETCDCGHFESVEAAHAAINPARGVQ